MIKQKAFTIIELIVVITVMAILASLIIVGYVSLSAKSNIASLQSDLTNNAKKLKLYAANYGSFPTSLNGSYCPTAPVAPTESSYCLNFSGSNTVSTYTGSTNAFNLKMKNGSINYLITEALTPIANNTFAVSAGGSGDDNARSVYRTIDGGCVVTGQTASFGAGNYDAFITKYDSSGNITWTRTWGGASTDYGYSVIQINDGGYLLAGQTASYGAGAYDSFIAKYDSAGNLSWSKTWGGTGDDITRSIIQTSEGGFAIAGYGFSFGAVGPNDIFLAKYDSSGNLSWSRKWGGSGDDIAMSLAQTSDGGFAITGYTNGSGAGLQDALVIKYSSSGNLSWSKTWGGTGNDYGRAVVGTSDGGVLLSGSTESYGLSGDVFLAKYDSSGNLSWSTTWGGGSNEDGNSLVSTTDGGYLVSGTTGSFGAGNYDIFIAKYDSAGNLSWSKTWGGTSTEYGYGVAQATDGGYFTAGATSSYGAGSYDFILTKFDSDGQMINCNTSTMCKTPSATTGSPSASNGNASGTSSTISATTGSPSATSNTFSPTINKIVLP